MKKFYAVFFSVFSFASFAQLSVTPGASATVLAQRIAGSGVAVTNANLNCGSAASGTFTYTGSDLGIPKGIILTTGAATDPANAESYFCNVQNGNSFTDPDLTTVEPNATNDVCLLEFDVVPSYNNISLTFVFGSEEYPTFVNSFNDGFGFFLTGPNPSGGTYSGKNIGVLPNGTPVSINNVNGSVNSTYFVANYTIQNTDIAYGGYTIPITSTVSVIAGSLYHMKIAVGDALDEAYDSGIFIEDSLFSSCASAPVVTFTTLGFADTVCLSNTTYTLTGGSPAGGIYYGAGVTPPNIFNPSNASSTGPHQLIYSYTDHNTGCASSATHVVYIQNCGVGFSTAQGISAKVYPVPCADVLNLETPLTSFRIEITNALGEIVLRGFSEEKNVAVDVKTLPPGTYVCTLVPRAGQLQRLHFVKQ